MTVCRSISAAVFFFVATVLSAAVPVVGIVEYLEGDVSLTRAGAPLNDFDIGSSVENYDLIKTGPTGRVVIALDKTTGMAGTLTVKPQSVFSVKSEAVKGSPATEGDMIAGAVSVKAKKVTGDPSLRIRTTTTVMGVRGTEFEVVISVNDSVLVGCSDGRVVCVDDQGEELEAVPGQSVIRNAGERLRRVPVAVSNLEQFRKNWIEEEIGVFKAAPLRALDQFAKSYRRHKADFDKAFEPLARDEALAAWAQEYRRGVVPRANDIAVMRQKAAVVPKIMAVRRVLFLFERVYYRLEDLRAQVGPEIASAALPSGGPVGEFYRELAADKAQLERKTAAYRFAVRLFAERNEGRDPVGGGEEEGDFFDDTSDFFN